MVGLLDCSIHLMKMVNSYVVEIYDLDSRKIYGF